MLSGKQSLIVRETPFRLGVFAWIFTVDSRSTLHYYYYWEYQRILSRNMDHIKLLLFIVMSRILFVQLKRQCHDALAPTTQKIIPLFSPGLQTPLQFSPAIHTLNSWQLLDADSSIFTVRPNYTQMESINWNKSWFPYCIATNSCHLINYAYKHINYGYLARIF